jgi:hypothetical protein
MEPLVMMEAIAPPEIAVQMEYVVVLATIVKECVVMELNHKRSNVMMETL